ncbi:MAG: hypothetical protein ACJ76H_12455 [Bacteriovoracaceae bacterium]
MSDLIQEVTPLTRAIVWIRPDQISPKDDHYKAIDYLLDGLLTATLKENASPSSLLVGNNFDKKLLVFSTLKDPKKGELESFLSLLEKDLGSEDKILIVDDTEGREGLLRAIPQKLLSHFHVIG